MHKKYFTANAKYDDSTMTYAMALNLANYTDASVRAFNIPTFTTESIWWRWPGGSNMHLVASTIHHQTTDNALYADLDEVITAWNSTGDDISLFDCWAIRDLTSLGFDKVVQNPWYLRLPGPIADITLPEGLSIQVVTTKEQLAAFEEASRLGFGELDVPHPDWVSFSKYHPTTLKNPSLAYVSGWLDGKVVSNVIAYSTEDMVGIYGLSTQPSFRRRGYAAALVHAVVSLRPDVPTSVFPDPPSVPIYTRIGFAPAGEIAFWKS